VTNISWRDMQKCLPCNSKSSLMEVLSYHNEQGATFEDSLSDYYLAIRELLNQTSCQLLIVLFEIDTILLQQLA